MDDAWVLIVEVGDGDVRQLICCLVTDTMSEC